MAREPVVTVGNAIREPVELLRAVESTSESGEVTRQWRSLGHCLAQVLPASVGEQLAAQQVIAGKRAIFRLWRTQVTQSLRSQDAIVWRGEVYELDAPAIADGIVVTATGVAKQ